VLKGISWTAASSLWSIATQLIQLAVLGRLLSPKEFGIAAIVQSFVIFSQTFVDAGVSNIILFRSNIAPELLRALFLINLACGVAVFSAIVATAPLVAGFYGEERLGSVLRFASISLLVMPIGQQSMFLLQKEQRFKRLAIIEIGSRAVGLATAIAVAGSGYGLYAIPSGVVVASLIGSIVFLWQRGSNVLAAKGWPKSAELKGVFAFGAYQMGDRLLNLAILESDTLIIGRLLGFADVGVYSVAKQLILRPLSIINPIVTRVATPQLARVQNDVAELGRQYMQVMTLVAMVNTAIFVYLGFEAVGVITLLMGKKWETAAPILQLLIGWGIVRAVGNPLGSLLVAVGQVRRGFLWSLANSLLFPAVIFAAHGYGLVGVAGALSVVSMLLLIPFWRFMIKPILRIGFSKFYLAIVRASAVPLAAGLLVWSFTRLVAPGQPPVFDAVLLAVVYGPVCAYLMLRLLKPKRLADA
jgi:O-antigen/teichoic acid export membrane protein